MLNTTEIDLMIHGTLNQDFDVITGADTVDEAIDIYVAGLPHSERGKLKIEVVNFLALNDLAIKTEFEERYINEFAPEEGKSVLLRILQSLHAYD